MIELKELLANSTVLSMPLKTPFRGLNHREVMIFESENGFSEWSPFLEYSTTESARWLKASLNWLENPRPKTQIDSITPNATLPAVDASEVERVLKNYRHLNTIKIKVAEPGQSRQTDLQRIQAAINFAPDANIRLDANGGLDIEQSLELIYWLKQNSVKLQYLEQPVKTIEELSKLKSEIESQQLDVLIAADESIRKNTDPFEVDSEQAADLMVVKWQPLGGIEEILEIDKKVETPLVVSSALESAVGLNAGIWLACSLDSGFDPGLGTSSLFVKDIVDELPMEAVEISPNRDTMKSLEADSETTARWHQRLTDCYGQLYSPE